MKWSPTVCTRLMPSDGLRHTEWLHGGSKMGFRNGGWRECQSKPRSKGECLLTRIIPHDFGSILMELSEATVVVLNFQHECYISTHCSSDVAIGLVQIINLVLDNVISLIE